MTQNKKLYNIALDLYMIHNCYRLAKILGNNFKPDLYYDSRDREFILFELDPDQAYETWEQIKSNSEQIDEYTGFSTRINPFCLVAGNCSNCFKYNYYSNNINKIKEIADQECLEIETILSKKWYQKCIQIVTELLGLED